MHTNHPASCARNGKRLMSFFFVFDLLVLKT